MQYKEYYHTCFFDKLKIIVSPDIDNETDGNIVVFGDMNIIKSNEMDIVSGNPHSINIIKKKTNHITNELL